MSGCRRNHRFEARYDTHASAPTLTKMSFESATPQEAVELVNASKAKTITYVRDVCVRCGKTIERTVTP